MLLAMMTMPDSQQYHNLYAINNVEELFIFLGFHCLILIDSLFFSAVEMRKSLL